MSTGDLKNNLRKLLTELKKLSYCTDKVDIDGVTKGIPLPFLEVYRYMFLQYSPQFTEQISSINVDLYRNMNDRRFIEGVYKVLRELFNYKPPITKEQFFSNGFAERKIIMCTNIVEMVHKKHKELRGAKIISRSLLSVKGDKKARPVSCPTSSRSQSPSVSQPLSRFMAARVSTKSTQPPAKTDKSSKLTQQNLKTHTSKQSPLDSVKVIRESLAIAGESTGNTYMLRDDSIIAPTNVSRINVVASLPNGSPSTNKDLISPAIDIVAMTPLLPLHSSPIERRDDLQLTNMKRELTSLNEFVSGLSDSLNRLTTKFTEIQTDISNREVPPGKGVVICKQDWDSVLARVTLIENRLLMLEDVDNGKCLHVSFDNL